VSIAPGDGHGRPADCGRRRAARGPAASPGRR